jgi:hypothetical protein
MDCTCAELTGSGSVATEASKASCMMPIISGGNDAFEKSFISVSIVRGSIAAFVGNSRKIRGNRLVGTCLCSISAQTALGPRVIQRLGMQARGSFYNIHRDKEFLEYSLNSKLGRWCEGVKLEAAATSLRGSAPNEVAGF